MRKEVWLLALIIVLGVALRLAVIPVYGGSYKPVDTYMVDEQATKLILNLQNPYAYTFSVHNYTLGSFAYLPMVPIYYVPFYLLGDLRYGNIFADVLIMLAAYWIAKSLNFRTAIYAPLAFAVLPWSIWLTSISSTNFMVGTAFLMLSVAALLRKKYIIAAVFLGLSVAANQLIVLALPLFGYYYQIEHKLSCFLPSLLVSAAVIRPFFLSSPSNFFHDVVDYPFIRPVQAYTPFSLNGILITTFNVQISTLIRISIFTISFLLATLLFRKKPSLFLLSAGVVLFLAAFVLPKDGLWNYFLPSFALCCFLAPLAGDEVDRGTQKISWWPQFLHADTRGSSEETPKQNPAKSK